MKLSKSERMLGLIEVLKKYSGEDHELDLKEITSLLSAMLDEAYEFQSSAIARDLEELEQSNFFDLIVNHEGKGFPKYYSYQNRLFEIQELRLLMDAVVSARFITKEEKEKMLDKIKQLTNKELAVKLENQIYIAENASGEENKVKYYIYNLHNAIHENKIIRFKYGRYNVQKEFNLSHDGKERELQPYALFWNNDYYYLIGLTVEDEIRHFRIDRMVDVHVTDQLFERDKDFNISTYTQQLFHMYSGVEKSLKVQFNEQLINVIIDRFGINVNIENLHDGTFIIRTKAIISEGLVRWLLTWGSDAKVIDPPELVAKLKKESEKMHQQYQVD